MGAARIAPACLAALLAACASKPSTTALPVSTTWPSWVVQPETAGGLAAAECVESSGNLSLDRSQAAAAARVTMARNLEVNIQASDELTTAKTELGTTMDDAKKDVIYELGACLELMNKPDLAIAEFKAIYSEDIGFRDVADKINAFYSKS